MLINQHIQSFSLFNYKPLFVLYIEGQTNRKQHQRAFSFLSTTLLIFLLSCCCFLLVPNMVLLDKGLSTAMNTKTVGSGREAIVLAHGFGGDQSLWDKILPDLAQHFRVVVFDWSFSGAVEDHTLFNPLKYSSYDAFANDLIALLDEMNLQSLVFVGHSMSGMIGCIASIKRPELFKQLILIGASPRYLQK